MTVQFRSRAEEVVRKVSPNNMSNEATPSKIAPREKEKSRPSSSTISFAVSGGEMAAAQQGVLDSQTIGGTRNGPNTFGSLNGPIARELS